MSEMLNNDNKRTRKRKNYPGDPRIPGTKDYALILTNLMSYSNKLTLEQDEKKVASLLKKVAEKLKELGFLQVSKSIKTKSKSPEAAMNRMTDIVETLNEKWRQGKEKHEKAKEKQKDQ